MVKKMSLNPYAQALKREQDELVVSYLPALRALAFRLKERLPSSIDESQQPQNHQGHRHAYR